MVFTIKLTFAFSRVGPMMFGLPCLVGVQHALVRCTGQNSKKRWGGTKKRAAIASLQQQASSTSRSIFFMLYNSIRTLQAGPWLVDTISLPHHKKIASTL